MRRPLIVFVGGGLGACLRALLLMGLQPWGARLPIPVLLANMLGAFALGVVYVLADEAGVLGTETRLFLAVGVLGGFTTFSTFGWGADLLLVDGQELAGLVYLAASLLGGVTAVWAGFRVGRALGAARRWTPAPASASRPARVTADIASIEAEDRGEPA